MERVRLGARDLMVSRLFYGTLTMGPLQRNLPVEEGAALIAYAAQRGVNFVDTAEYYETYPYVREALKVEKDLIICTKSYAWDEDSAKRSLEKAQEGIGRERIDLFLLHEQESQHTLRGHAGALGFYLDMRERGVIGAVGLSTHHVAAVQAAKTWPGIDVVFPILNAQGLGVADGTRGDMELAAAGAHANGRAVLAMKALGGGHLIDRREEALRYAMNLPFVTAVAVGMQSLAEIDYNVALFEGRAPEAKAAAASAAAPRALLVESWCDGCGRCEKRCGLGAIAVRDGRAQVDPLRCVRCGYCAGVCPHFCLKVI